MTGTKPDQLAKLEEKRQALFRQFLNLNGSAAARDHVLAMTVKIMTTIAKGNYHPAVRYNAVLILGQLDKEPAATGANAKAPTPLAAGTAALVDLLEGGQANAAAIPSSVTVAALVGLDRQTRLGVDPQFADRITKGALAVATLAQQPEDVSKPVFDWMRALAGSVLANQYAKGLTPPVHTALVKLMTDKKMGLDDRCGVARMLRGSMYQGAQGVKIEEAVAALGALSKDVLAEEAEKSEDYQSELVPDSALAGGGFGEFGGRSGFGGYGGEYGGPGGDPLMALQDQGPHYEKRRMLDRVGAIVTAANSLSAAGSDEVKARLKELSGPMAEVTAAAAKNDATDAGVTESVVELAAEVNKVVQAWNAAGAEAEPAAEAPAAEPAEAAAPGN
jgi:hypothetical protein